MGTFIKKICKLGLLGGLICIFFITVIVIMHWPANEVILESCQTEENRWEVHSRLYCLKVVKKGRDWSDLFSIVIIRWNYELVLSPTQAGIGYSIKYSFLSPGEWIQQWTIIQWEKDKTKSIQQSTIRWEKKGVTLITPSGNQVFLKIPKHR